MQRVDEKCLPAECGEFTDFGEEPPASVFRLTFPSFDQLSHVNESN